MKDTPARTRARLAGLTVLGVALAGCVTDPGYVAAGPELWSFGYSEQLNPDGGYTIVVRRPNTGDPHTAFVFWDRRASELCPNGYRRQVHTANRNLVVARGYTPATSSYEVAGYAYCNPAPGQAAAAPGAV